MVKRLRENPDQYKTLMRQLLIQGLIKLIEPKVTLRCRESDVKIVLVLLIELLLFGLDGFLQPDGVITTSLAVNVFDFLLSVHLDEGYHRVQDLCTLR